MNIFPPWLKLTYPFILSNTFRIINIFPFTDLEFFFSRGGGVSGIFKSGTTPIPVGEFFRTSSPSTCNPRMFTQSRNHVPMWFYFCGYSHGWKIGVLHLLSLSPSFTGSLIFIYRHPQNDKSWGYIFFLFAVSAHAN